MSSRPALLPTEPKGYIPPGQETRTAIYIAQTSHTWYIFQVSVNNCSIYLPQTKFSSAILRFKSLEFALVSEYLFSDVLGKQYILTYLAWLYQSYCIKWITYALRLCVAHSTRLDKTHSARAYVNLNGTQRSLYQITYTLPWYRITHWVS